MTLALLGSLQLVRPMDVITTVGLTAFTRICKEASELNNA